MPFQHAKAAVQTSPRFVTNAYPQPGAAAAPSQGQQTTWMDNRLSLFMWRSESADGLHVASGP
ncbi:MAG: hypothetical protein ABI894_14215 [Ilumatobacteraceae bacterium]